MDIAKTADGATEPAGMVQADNTQPQAATAGQNPAAHVDMEKLAQIASERAAKSAEKIFRESLEKRGLDDDAVSEMVKEYKAKRKTPEQLIEQLKKERDEGFAARDAELNALRQEKFLRGYGLTDDEDIEVYGIRINRLVTEGKTFEQTAKEYFEAHPRPSKIPASATYDGSNKTPLAPSEIDGIKSDYEKARKAGNGARMIELRMLAKQKGYQIE